MTPAEAGTQPSGGAAALQALVDARALEGALQGIRSRLLALGQKVDVGLGQADHDARMALKRLDDLATTRPADLGVQRASENTWQAIARASRQLADIEVDASDLLERRPSGEATA